MIYTIESDDEIEAENTSGEDTDDEVYKASTTNTSKVTKLTSKKNKASTVKAKPPSFHFEFDDGETSYRNTQHYILKESKSKSAKDDDEGEDDDGEEEVEDIEDKDHVRLMPHSEERLIRARDKLQKKKKDKNNKNEGDDVEINDDGEEDNYDDDNNDDNEEGNGSSKMNKNKKNKMTKHHDGASAGVSQVGMSAEEEGGFFDAVLNTATSSSSSSSRKKNSSSSTDYDNNNNEDDDVKMFSELSLSRPLLRGVEAAGYVTPTPVQSSVIPLALAGRDVCASAATGSGKTAAFLLPCLERLQYRSREVAAIRVLVVTPTRELATQIHNVLQKLSAYTDVTSALICGGGRDVRIQESTLRLRPDIVICTPGRMLDHLRNSHSVRIDELDVLILDEVDRLLDLGFQDEVEELVRHCPTGRQTLLFSATLTSKVEDLVRLSLRRPVRVKTSLTPGALAPRLVQEFVKVKDESEREAVLLSLITRSFHHRTIVFCETKKETHRVYLLCKLANIQVGQLHGDMTQAQRYQSLEQFRISAVQVLVATDVAARGLDIPGVQTIVNAEMPRNSSTYIHRVGRTARAGSGGRSITLVTDARRKVVKEILKSEAALNSNNGNNDVINDMKGRILSRSVPAAVVAEFLAKIATLESDVIRLTKEEQIKNQIRDAFQEADRAENMLLYEQEIASRPARTWYQTETQKQARREETRKIADEEKLALTKQDNDSDDEGHVRRKKIALQMADDYRDESNKGSNNSKATAGVTAAHRLSRKKRRRQEALKESQEASAEEAENKANGNIPIQKIGSKKIIPKSKASLREAAAEKKGQRTIAEIGELRETKKRSRMQLEGSQNKKSTKDLMRPRFAVGGLDQDSAFGGEYNGSSGNNGVGGSGNSGGMSNKKKIKLQDRKIEAELSYEYDPSKKLKKGGKIGSHAFKSKKRFKRR